MYNAGEDSPLNDFISYIVGGFGVGYALSTWQKLKPNSMVPGLVGAGAGLVAFGARHYVRRPTPQALLEATGYSTAGNLGSLVAANTVTIGGIAPGPIELNRTPATTTTTTTGAVRKVNSAVEARRRALAVQPPPPPPRRPAFEVEY